MLVLCHLTIAVVMLLDVRGLLSEILARDQESHIRALASFACLIAPTLATLYFFRLCSALHEAFGRDQIPSHEHDNPDSPTRI